MNWKSAFDAALVRFADTMSVERGSTIVAKALDEICRNSFVVSSIRELGRTVDETGAEALRSRRIPISKSRTIAIDPDWKLEELEDRNDRWVAQQWLFVRHCATEAERSPPSLALRGALHIAHSWADVNLVTKSAERTVELNWHDHATALRAINIVWLACLLHASDVPPEAYLELLFKLIEVHTVVLMSDDFYSVGTNHGFDQAYALYLLTSAFPLSDTQRTARRTARARLISESNTAFNEEGVHIENSPGYHALMVGRLLRAKAIVEAFDGPGILDVDETIEKALSFLTMALRPDGTLPLLGDTEALPIRPELERLERFEAYPQLLHAYTGGKRGTEPAATAAAFPRAGYAFLRDRWPSPDHPDCVHISFKCGFLSSYHRHDDDNTVLLFAYGEDWLVGAGIYKYHEQDDIRRYLRSSLAHNLLNIDNVVPVRNVREAQWEMGTLSTSGSVTTVRASTRMFPGFTCVREVEFDREASIVTLRDSVEPNDEMPHSYTLRFNVPYERAVDVLSPTAIRVRSLRSGKSMCLDVQCDSVVDVEVDAGRADPPVGWTSPQRGVVHPAHAISFKGIASGRFEIVSKISFVDNEVTMTCSACDPAIERAIELGSHKPLHTATPVLIDGELADARCKNCGSRARHRALASLLTRAGPLLQFGSNVLLISASKPERSIYRRHFRTWRHVSLMGTHDDPDCETGVDVTTFESSRLYDYIFAWGVFDYIPETRQALRALAATLAPGGALVFYVMPYRLGSDVEEMRVVHRNALKYESYAPPGATTGIPHCKFNPDALLRWMREAGLEASIAHVQDEISAMVLSIFIGRRARHPSQAATQ